MAILYGMSPVLFIIIALLSAGLGFFFISREAKRFAVSPPAPLVDLDRMYDKIYLQIDEETGASITPADLQNVLEEFIKVLSRKGYVAEDITSGNIDSAQELTSEQIAAEIRKENTELGVAHLALVRIIELSLTYLKDIRALS